ncbi:MAG: winged helix-turn-helix domain-containing protein [Acidobacteriota bacterium]
MNRISQEWTIAGRRIRPDLNRVVGPDGETSVEPRTVAVLMVLAGHPRQVFSRQELLAAVWGETAVVDESLTRCISDLRKLFGDDPRRPQVIETIHRRGYRLIAEVAVEEVSGVVPSLSEDVPETRIEAEPAAGSEPAGSGAAGSGRPTRRGGWSWRSAATALVAISVLAFGRTSCRSLAPEGALRPSQMPSKTSQPLTVRPATSLHGAEIGPALSPNGEHVVFGLLPGHDPVEIDLFLQQVGGGETRRLTHEGGLEVSPAWAPDGQEVAFLRAPASAGSPPCQVVRLDLVTGVEQVWARCGRASPSALSWSPDGVWLLLSDRSSSTLPYRLSRLSAERRAPPQVLTSPSEAQHGDRFPAISPDGRWIAFARAESLSPGLGNLGAVVGRIHVMPAGGGESREVGATRELFGLDWDAGGGAVLFLGVAPGLGWGIFRLDVENGSSSTILAPSGTLRRHLRSARSGGRVVFEDWSGETDLWRRSLAGAAADSGAERWADSTQWEAHPAFSPSGDRVAFVSTRAGSMDVWIAGAAGDRARQITFRGQVRTARPSWSPDGTRIAFESGDHVASSIFIVDLANQRTTAVTTAASDDRGPSWSVDGRWIYFGSNRSGSWQIWRTPATGGGAEQVTRSGGLCAREVLVGGEPQLLFARSDGVGLWLASPDGDEELVAGPAPGDPWNWTVAGETVYYAEPGSSGLLLAAQDLIGGPPRVLLPLADSDSRSVPGLTVSPDGSWLLSAEHRNLSADLYLVDVAR